MKQTQKRKCAKGAQHTDRFIQAVCLQQQCKNDRLLCFYCICQSHSSHEYVQLLSGLGSAIEKVNINSHIQNVQQKQRQVMKMMRRINNNWTSLYRLCQQNLSKIYNSIQPQKQAIQQSFDKESAQRMINQLTNKQSTAQIIQKNIQKLKLIKRYDLSNVDQVKKSTQIVKDRLDIVYKQARQHINQIMNKIQQQSDLFKNLHQLQINTTKRRHNLAISQHNQFSICISHGINTLKQYQAVQKYHIKRRQNKYLQKKRNIMNQKQKHEHKQFRRQESFINQQQLLCQKVHPNKYNKQLNEKDFITVQNIENKMHNYLSDQTIMVKTSDRDSKKLDIQLTQPKKQYIQHQVNQQDVQAKQLNEQDVQQLSESSYESLAVSPVRFEQQQQSQPTIPYICMSNILITRNSLQQIYTQLTKIPSQYYLKIRYLQISCDVLPLCINNQILNIIIKFKNLTRLVLCQCVGLTKIHFKRIINTYQNIQELVLQQSYILDQEMAQLIQSKMKRLKRFYYTTDTFKHLNFRQHNIEMMADFEQKTSIRTMRELVKLPFLQTIVLQDINKQKDIKSQLSHLKNIKQASIIFNQRSCQINQVLYTLELKCYNLMHLQLMQCKFKQYLLINVLKKTKQLRSLVLNKCTEVTNKTVEVLGNFHATLKQLDFTECDSITGNGFQKFISLQILGIKACWKMNTDIIGPNISKLTQLKSLNLNLNRYWLTQDIFIHIKELNNLELLGIDDNQIQLSSLIKIKNLENLSSLILGNTELSGQDVLKFLAITCSKIRKLSLKRDNYKQKSTKNQIINQPFEGKLLNQIGDKAPQISHLNIRGMKNVRRQHFTRLKNLKCISCGQNQLDQETILYMRQRNICLYIEFKYYQYSKQQNKNEQQIDQEEQIDQKELIDQEKQQYVNKQQISTNKKHILIKQKDQLIKQKNEFIKQQNELIRQENKS